MELTDDFRTGRDKGLGFVFTNSAGSRLGPQGSLKSGQ
jgi:hypothetical protein